MGGVTSIEKADGGTPSRASATRMPGATSSRSTPKTSLLARSSWSAKTAPGSARTAVDAAANHPGRRSWPWTPRLTSGDGAVGDTASAHAAVKARAASGTTRRADCLRFTDTSRGVALGIDHWLPRRSRQWAANHLFIGLLCQGLEESV